MRKFILFFLLAVCILFLTGCNNYQSKYESASDQNLSLQSELDKTISNYEKQLESVYADIQKTSDCIYIVNDYFEGEGVSIDKASKAFDELYSILSKYY